MKTSKETAAFLEALVYSTITTPPGSSSRVSDSILEILVRHGYPTKVLYGVANTYIEILPREETR